MKRGLFAITGLAVAASTAILSAGSITANAAVTGGGATDAVHEMLVDYLVQSDHLTKAQAEAQLALQTEGQRKYDQLADSGVKVDGAFVAGNQFVVLVKDDATAAAVAQQGLTPRKALTQSDLDAVAAKVMDATASEKSSVFSAGADIVNGVVEVTVAPEASKALREKIAAIGNVKIVNGEPLQPQAMVVPGQKMHIVGSGNCSLGFPGKKGGKLVMISAGHCLANLPKIDDGKGNALGKGVDTRFKQGRDSVDMGLMEIASGVTGADYVYTHGFKTSKQWVKGTSKAAVGSALCKGGITTGWTCGKVQAWNQTVNYGDTKVSGLGKANVCTEPGDSGGAYIANDGMAQGMTSGGPRNQNCGGFNSGNNSSSKGYSFFQPAKDAVTHYSVTLLTHK